MNDQDEMFEAATETPAFLGCPQHMPKALPSGFDGTEPATPSDEAKAKLEASVARQRELLTKIADLALAAEAKSGNANVNLGSKWLDNSKAICAIRQLCGPDLVEKAQIESGAFYTPGWLCELAKKLQGAGTVPSASSPTGADKAAKTAEYMRRKYSFCDGLFPIRRANCEKAVTEHCWIGGRRFTMEMSEDIHDHGLTHVCCAKIRDNGKLIAKLVVNRGKSMAEHMAHATFKAYVKNLSGSNRLSSRGGFLKAAIKRAAAKQQAHDNKAENGGQA